MQIGSTLAMMDDMMSGGDTGDTTAAGETDTCDTCLRCGRNNHVESQCKSKDKTCTKCTKAGIGPALAVGHFESIHDVTDDTVRCEVIELLGKGS